MFCILSHVSCISESQNSWPWTSRAHWNEFGNTNQRNSETQSCTGLDTFSLPGVREWPPTFNEFRWSRVRTVGMTETWSAWAPLVKWFVITFAVVKPTSLHIPDANAPSPKPQLPRIGDGKGPNHNVVFALGSPWAERPVPSVEGTSLSPNPAVTLHFIIKSTVNDDHEASFAIRIDSKVRCVHHGKPRKRHFGNPRSGPQFLRPSFSKGHRHTAMQHWIHQQFLINCTYMDFRRLSWDSP